MTPHSIMPSSTECGDVRVLDCDMAQYPRTGAAVFAATVVVAGAGARLEAACRRSACASTLRR